MTPPPTPATDPHATAADAVRAETVDAAIASRRSIRAFVPTAVPRATVEAILSVASRAPSGTNTQPWKVVVFTGGALQALVGDILRAYDDPEERSRHVQEYEYYPSKWFSPYIDRRRKVGWDLYGLLGIDKSDKAGMTAQHRRNFEFFGAPVGLMFYIDRALGQGSWLDFGMFIENVMIAARGRGLDTCPQAAFAQFHRIVDAHAGAPAGDMLVCGMALGHADPRAVENTLVTEREPIAGFCRFLDTPASPG